METPKKFGTCFCGKPQGSSASGTGDLKGCPDRKTLTSTMDKGYDVVPCKVNVYGFL
jgi:hypothetical protein